MTRLSSLLLALVCVWPVHAQSPEGEKPPRPPMPPFGTPPMGGGKDSRGMFGGRGRHHGDGFDKLSEVDKAKVRKAMDAAWQKPEVQAARDRLMKANDEFRDALRDSLKSIDPEVVTILDKIRPDTPSLVSQPWPKPEAADFAEASIARLGKELSMFAKPERREAMLLLHQKLIESPALKDLVKALQAAPVDQRIDAFKKLHSAYREQAKLAYQDSTKKAKGDAPRDAVQKPE